MDKRLIKGKIEYLDELLKKTKRKYDLYSKEKDEENLDTLYLAISKLFEEICEVAISINNLLLEDKGDIAETYALSFLKLKEHYKFDKKFIDSISKSSSFRNKMVHNYSSLEEELTIEKVKEFILLYEKYKILILDFLEKNKK